MIQLPKPKLPLPRPVTRLPAVSVVADIAVVRIGDTVRIDVLGDIHAGRIVSELTPSQARQLALALGRAAT